MINKLGEFGLIERFRKSIRTDASLVESSGDDCAVIKFDKRRHMLFTCDMLVEGVDFISQEDPYLVGRKSLAVSISDIAACAGIPRWCLIALGLPIRTRLSYADRLFKGMRDIARAFRINIAGGDLSRAPKLTVDVSMLGLVKKEELVLRSGAAQGDAILVTGSLGGSLSGKHLRFTPRVKEARFLSENFKINAMIDISDGLIQDLGHILKASRVGAVVYADCLPFSKQARGLSDVLYSGEDFELLFTISFLQARKLMAAKPRDYHLIGEVVAEKKGLILIDKNGRRLALKAGGFRHF